MNLDKKEKKWKSSQARTMYSTIKCATDQRDIYFSIMLESLNHV